MRSDDALLVRDPIRLVDALTEAGATGGVSAPFARLATAPEALRQANVAALCARPAGPRSPPTTGSAAGR